MACLDWVVAGRQFLGLTAICFGFPSSSLATTPVSTSAIISLRKSLAAIRRYKSSIAALTLSIRGR